MKNCLQWFSKIFNITITLYTTPRIKKHFNCTVQINPDLRFELPIQEITDLFHDTEIEFLKKQFIQEVKVGAIHTSEKNSVVQNLKNM